MKPAKKPPATMPPGFLQLRVISPPLSSVSVHLSVVLGDRVELCIVNSEVTSLWSFPVHLTATVGSAPLSLSTPPFFHPGLDLRDVLA
jgi:hypothetical protein